MTQATLVATSFGLPRQQQARAERSCDWIPTIACFSREPGHGLYKPSSLVCRGSTMRSSVLYRLCCGGLYSSTDRSLGLYCGRSSDLLRTGSVAKHMDMPCEVICVSRLAIVCFHVMPKCSFSWKNLSSCRGLLDEEVRRALRYRLFGDRRS